MDHEEIRLDLIEEGILDIYDEENPTAIRFKLESLSATAIKPNPAWTGSTSVYLPTKKRVSSAAS
jgi:hypothetical protein